MVNKEINAVSHRNYGSMKGVQVLFRLRKLGERSRLRQIDKKRCNSMARKQVCLFNEGVTVLTSPMKKDDIGRGNRSLGSDQPSRYASFRGIYSIGEIEQLPVRPLLNQSRDRFERRS